MARGPQVALSPGHRAEGRIAWGAELRCLPRGLEAEGSPPQLATWRTWRGEPGACPARPAEVHCSGKGGKQCWRLGSVARHVCREGVPCSPAASSPLGFNCPAGPQGWPRGTGVPSLSGAAAPPVQTSVQPQAVSGWWGLGPPQGSLRGSGPELCPVLRAGGPRIAEPSSRVFSEGP